MNPDEEMRYQDSFRLVPGHNVDPVDVEAGAAEAVKCGYDDASMQMLIRYCLGRWAKGEEALAEKTAVGMGIDFTSWRRCVAVAVVAGEAALVEPTTDGGEHV